MSKNQIAREHENLYQSIKSIDVNSLKVFMYSTTADVVDAINHWEKRRLTLIKPTDKDQRDLIALEIMRLESILLARTCLTMDFFGVKDLYNVVQDSAIISKDLVSQSPISQTTEELPFVVGEKDKLTTIVPASNVVDNTIKVEPATKVVTETDKPAPEAKVIQLVPEKIKLTDLQEKCVNLLIEGKKDEALTLAKSYLIAGLYIPSHAKQKADKWHEGRIKGWLTDLEKQIMKKTELQKLADNKTVTAIPSSAAKDAVKHINTAPTAKPATTETTKPATVKRAGKVDIQLEPWDKFMAWVKDANVNLEDWFEKEELAKTAEGERPWEVYDCITFTTDDVDGTITLLNELYGITSKENVDVASKDVNGFKNQTGCLSEEIQLIEGLLEKCHKLRGDVASKPENLDQIEDLIADFFETRDNNDYEEYDKLFNVIKDRPAIMKSAKEFFSMISYPKVSLLSLKDEKGVPQLNLYEKIIKEIKEDLKKVEGKDDKTIAEFQTKWINLLRGKMLGGMDEKTKNIINKITFYTQYHVLYFIEQIANEAYTGTISTEAIKSHPVNDNLMGESVATATTPVAAASTEPVTAPSEKKQDPTTPKIHVCTSVEEAILLVITNGGKVEDAYIHPFCESLKDTEVNNPWNTGKIILNNENYKKYLDKKFQEVQSNYEAQRTVYPIKDMTVLIQTAIEDEVSPEDFVKDNINLVKKSDGTYLKLSDKVEEVEVFTPLKSDKDFLDWVKDIYILEAKRKAAESKVYPDSEIKSWKEFDEQIDAKAKTMPLNQLQQWARETVVDKVFPEANVKVPPFTSDKVTALDSYLEIRTRKVYETPEIVADKKQKFMDHIAESIKTTKVGLLGFANEMRKYCTANRLDYRLSEVKDMCVEVAEKHNPEMYKKYMENHTDLKTENLLPETIPAEKVEKNVIISEQPVASEVTNDLVKEIFEKTKNVKTKREVENILQNYKHNPVAVLRACMWLFSDKSQNQIKDGVMTDTEINTWVTNLLKKDDKPTTDKPADKPITVNEKFAAFATLKSATDKKQFRESLDTIVTNFEDSSEIRGKIIEAISKGEGSHTKVVAKGGAIEMQKMIKKAFERVENEKVKAELV